MIEREHNPSPLLELTIELLEAAIGYRQRLDDACSNQYRNPTCCGCGGQKERVDQISHMPFHTLCRACVRRLPKELRHGFWHSYGDQHDVIMLQILRWLKANPRAAAVKRARPRKAVA